MSGITIDHKPGGNDIVKMATPERLNDGTPACGWDSYGQLWVRFNDRTDEPNAWTGHIVADARKFICPVCQRGWESTAKGLADQEFIHSMERMAHRTCMNGYGHLSNFFFWHGVVCNVPRDDKKPALEFKEIKNQYGSSWTGPWYTTVYACMPQHTFTTGMRKRVYQISINGVPKEFADVLEFSFKAEDVTKGYRDGEWYIHAWGREKAEKYFTSIHHLANCWQTELERKAQPVQP